MLILTCVSIYQFDAQAFHSSYDFSCFFLTQSPRILMLMAKKINEGVSKYVWQVLKEYKSELW